MNNLDKDKIIVEAAREVWGELYVSLTPDHLHHQSHSDAVCSSWRILSKAFEIYNNKD